MLHKRNAYQHCFARADQLENLSTPYKENTAGTHLFEQRLQSPNLEDVVAVYGMPCGEMRAASSKICQRRTETKKHSTYQRSDMKLWRS
jgi:hypothetical protein